MSKKFFWLKLKNDFFDRDEIKIIENQQNGKDYIIFYMKLLLKSVESEGRLFFRNTIPYSPEMLATITNTSVDTVKVAVDLFIELQLMERWDDGTLFMIETENMVGTETKWAQYKRKERDEKKENKNKIGHCPIVVQKSPIEIDKELEKFKKNTGLYNYTLQDAARGINYMEKVEKSKKTKKYGTGYINKPKKN